MRPGQEHLVYTLEDCIARGGHFYTHKTLEYSFFAGIREALHGQSSTNDMDDTAETVLQWLLSSYHKHFMCAKMTKTEHVWCLCMFFLTADWLLLACIPVDDNLAALVVMNLFPEDLESQRVLGDDKEDWEWAVEREWDREQAHMQALDILAHCRELLAKVQGLVGRHLELQKRAEMLGDQDDSDIDE